MITKTDDQIVFQFKLYIGVFFFCLDCSFIPENVSNKYLKYCLNLSTMRHNIFEKVQINAEYGNSNVLDHKVCRSGWYGPVVVILPRVSGWHHAKSKRKQIWLEEWVKSWATGNDSLSWAKSRGTCDSDRNFSWYFESMKRPNALQ